MLLDQFRSIQCRGEAWYPNLHPSRSLEESCRISIGSGEARQGGHEILATDVYADLRTSLLYFSIELYRERDSFLGVEFLGLISFYRIAAASIRTVSDLVIAKNRQQKLDAVNYRATKALEVTEAEKVVAGEVRELDKRRQALEAELAEVKSALAAATVRHINIQEEKEQFDTASSNIVAHLSVQEEELSKSINACKTEANIASICVNFLEDTRVLQSASEEQKVKDTEASWEESKQEFLQIAAINLAYHQVLTEKLAESIT
ncbi:hypothetical protein R1flu_001894 [Riccia fluitans]|uniref:Uncharacterized protein n=1 Tax=Riccia fluitans TaxID=41844 RepID=A0ABD1Y4K3_9MARC